MATNRAPLDGWTIVHAGAGVALGMLRVPWWAALTGGAIYEVAEQVVERTESGQRFFRTCGPESVVNVAADLVAYMGGWAGGYALREAVA